MRARRRPMHYTVFMLHDGTVLAAFPIRKPSQRVLKQDGRRIDSDGVVVEHAGAGKELSDHRNETRCRFQDIIAASLNSRRAIRALVLPVLAQLRTEVQVLREQLDRIENRLPKSGVP